MKKIRKIDHPLRGGYHYFHRFLEPYSVAPWFLLEEAQWHDYREFESYRYDQRYGFPPQNTTKEELEDWLDKNPSIQDMQRLLSRSKCQIWQFNAALPKSKNQTEKEYVRNFAVFSETTMKELSIFEERLLYPYLKLKAACLNVYVNLYNKLVMLMSMTPEKAKVFVDKGGIVSTLDYGARQYLFKNILGKLYYKTPFEKEWEQYTEKTLPSYYGNFIKHIHEEKK
jgi:hypothetical protein